MSPTARAILRLAQRTDQRHAQLRDLLGFAPDWDLVFLTVMAKMSLEDVVRDPLLCLRPGLTKLEEP